MRGATRHSSVLITTPLKGKEKNPKIIITSDNYTSYFKYSDKSVLLIERSNAFTLLKSVDSGKLFKTLIFCYHMFGEIKLYILP